MGILFDKVQLSREIQMQDMVQQLQNRGITEDKNGTSIHQLDYYQLQSELNRANFREINAECDANKYF